MSTALVGETCEACRKDSPRVTEAQIEELKPFIPDWNLIDVDGVPRLERSFKFSDYPDALAFTQAVGELAESQGHHPVITVEARRVRITWWTHAIKFLHRNDFIMAAKTDEIFNACQSREGKANS
jgi:4a-hydroxytetrahydrobiopterin dehydratase